MTDAELAYAAGLIDGEGCITIDKPGGVDRLTKYRTPRAGLILRVRVYNSNEAMITWLHTRFGGTAKKAKYKQKAYHLDQWYWQLLGKNAAAFLQQIHPFLVAKKTEAEFALLHAETLHEQWHYRDAGGHSHITEEASHLRLLALLGIRQAKSRGNTKARAVWVA